MTKRRVAVGLCLVALASACAPGARARVAEERRRGEAERRALDGQLDALEERLLADQARVRLWRELRDRHESVSAIATVNLDRHAGAVALLGERQGEKRGRLAGKERLAARAEAATARR